MSDALPDRVDLIVLGSGAAGMTAALTARLSGLSVVMLEKTDRIGGTTARSAGSAWLPNTRHAEALGVDDNIDQSLLYLKHAVGNRLNTDLAATFLHKAPAMVEWLETNTVVNFRAYPHHPDYLADLPGATLAGRVLEPKPFDARALGSSFRHLREPLDEFTLMGGMMVDRTDITHLMGALKRPASLAYAARLLVRYGVDRLRHTRGTRLVMGNALVGRLYKAVLDAGVHVVREAEVTSLLQSDAAVTGVQYQRQGAANTLNARAGVVLATGGFSFDARRRESLMQNLPITYSAVASAASGDGAALAEQCGGAFTGVYESNSFWAPASRRQRPDGSVGVFPHFVLDRGKPGVIAIDPRAQRFVNEATTYHRFGEALIAVQRQYLQGHCHLVCDDQFIARYGLGCVRPKRLNLKALLKEGYLMCAPSVASLAVQLNVSADDLQATIDRHNRFAETGVDEDFHKGEDAYQRNLGDAAHQPNCCIGKIDSGPFYAVRIFPADIGASAGLLTDVNARVLNDDGQPINGLYACGNDMASIMAGSYPGPGITIGPGMVFGYIAALHASNSALNERL